MKNTTTTRQTVVCSCCHGTGSVEIISGEAIRARREATGMSLRTVATQLQVSAAYLSDLELGNRPIHDAMLERIEKIIGPESDIAPGAPKAKAKRNRKTNAADE